MIFFHIKGNIKILTPNGYFFKTDEIFWDKNKKKIFNKKNVTISNLNGTILHAKKGIEMYNNLKNFKLKDISGVLPL